MWKWGKIMVGFLLRQRAVVASQLNTRNVSCMVCSPTFGYLVKRNVGGVGRAGKTCWHSTCGGLGSGSRKLG